MLAAGIYAISKSRGILGKGQLSIFTGYGVWTLLKDGMLVEVSGIIYNDRNLNQRCYAISLIVDSAGSRNYGSL
jgi:hypothetical protein